MAGGRKTTPTREPRRTNRRPAPVRREADYRHPTAEAALRPEVGTQAQFRKKKPPVAYRYDSSFSPALDWDGQNPAREQGEAAILEILQLDSGAIDASATSDETKKAAREFLSKAKSAADKLKRLSRPFLNWTGKAEHLSFDVATLPLFVHERLSTKAIIETLKSHEKQSAQIDMLGLFGDPNRSVSDQVLRAYEYKDKWVNRLILGDSLIVMNSLLNYEDLGGQVQMIYIDPPYGVKFGSNFQPFVRKRDVSHNDDEDMTREPEMVKAYRDTWELGLHSYLTYLRDRLLLARDLLHPSGSVFVQIGDENVHHVRELLEEIFDGQNFVSLIPFRKKTMPLGAKHLEGVGDYLLWYARDKERLKYRPQYTQMSVEGDTHWNCVELPDGSRRKMTRDEINNHKLLPSGSTPIQLVSLYPAGVNESGLEPFRFRGKKYPPPPGNSWFTNPLGMQRLAEANRIEPYEDGETLRYVLKLSDAPYSSLTNFWADTSAPSDKTYVVQTSTKVVQRCLLMTTDPGDLVLDPTCGSGTTAFVSERWGRRWITVDTSRVPLALTRQRMLSATFEWFKLLDPQLGPSSGFEYQRKKNRRGEEVGGICPYISKGSIANNEPSDEIVLLDRPEEDEAIVRVSGPFTVEATIPTPLDLDGMAADSDVVPTEYASFIERMLEVLRKSPNLLVGGGKTVTLKDIRQPAKSLALSAEATIENGNGFHAAMNAAHEVNTGGLRFTQRSVAIVFGPENGAVSEKLVFEAAREAHAKSFSHLYVIGFAIQANARDLIQNCEATAGIPATYVQATPDLMMGDLLKTTRASQIFSVCGMPDIRIRRLKLEKDHALPRYQIELLGYDVFDPTTMELEHKPGHDVPAWMLDTNYNGLVFHGLQVFFPRTSAWDSLKKALRATHDQSVWDHLAGTTSAPFEAGEYGAVAVKVIDDRGNELLVVKNLRDAEPC